MKSNLVIAVLLFMSAIAYSQKETAKLDNPTYPDTKTVLSKIPNKANPDTLTYDELNLYNKQAVALRNTGRVLTFAGIGLTAAGFLTGAILMDNPRKDSDPYVNESFGKGIGIMFLSGIFGITSAIIGIPSWAVGAKRNARAELALQKFNIVQTNSIAVGVGVRIRF